MKIQPVSVYRQMPSFRAEVKSKETKTENPINRETEKNLSILGAVGSSAVLGAATAGITTCFINKDTAHRYLKAGGVGAAVAAVALLLTLPAKLYDTNVKSFTREKEMEVYGKDKEVQSKLYGELDRQVQDEEVPLENKISNYASMAIAKQGSGVIVKHGV